MPNNEFEQFVKLLQALEPWLGEIVIVGGWAHRLHRFHEFAQPLDYKPLMTFDTDIAVPQKVSIDRRNIAQRLQEYGFTESFLGDHHPPVTQYRLGPEHDGFYAEFLTPLHESGYTRDGKPDQTVRIAGISSQKLRYLDVLLHDPWKVSAKGDVQPAAFAPVRVANPTAFIVQKLLIHHKRNNDERAKDILYIHDTVELFGSKLEKLNELWRQSVSLKLHPNHVTNVRVSAAAIFAKVNDMIRDASQIARSAGRTVPSQDIQAVCSLGLEQILADS
jgi:hypothetical protein